MSLRILNLIFPSTRLLFERPMIIFQTLTLRKFTRLNLNSLIIARGGRGLLEAAILGILASIGGSKLQMVSQERLGMKLKALLIGIEHPTEIEETLVSYFGNLFSSTNLNMESFDAVSNLIQPRIDGRMSASLTLLLLSKKRRSIMQFFKCFQPRPRALMVFQLCSTNAFGKY